MGRYWCWADSEKAAATLHAGNLNLGSLKAKNIGLLAKWWWRFQMAGNVLWVRIIQSIYGHDGGLRDESQLRYNAP